MMTNIPEKAIYAPSRSIIQVKNLCLMQVYGFMHNSLLPEPWASKSYAYSRVMLVYSMLMERFYCIYMSFNVFLAGFFSYTVNMRAESAMTYYN